MTTLASAVDTTFTPSTGTFEVQCTGGEARLDRRNTSGNEWGIVGYLENGAAFIVDNPVPNTQFRFTQMSGNPTVQADQ